MIQTAVAARGMVVTPHHLASQAGLAVLREGGNAIEAMIASASTIAVVYPHMNGIGGDNFWLISVRGKPPIGIDGSGRAAISASRKWYAEREIRTVIPSRGPLAALTVAGAVSGWDAALKLAHANGGRLPLSRLLSDAVHYARAGFSATSSHVQNQIDKLDELQPVPGFSASFMPEGALPTVGAVFRNPRLASTIEHLAAAGLDDFYRGELAAAMASDLERAGSPLKLIDFHNHHAETMKPLSVSLPRARATAYGIPPPTQGLASMMTLGLFEEITPSLPDGFSYVHNLIEATKQAFLVRDTVITDPAYMQADPSSFLTPVDLKLRAAKINQSRALPWPNIGNAGDTVWLGAIDKDGLAVSFIQSNYWEFGSALVLENSGIVWQNRGISFSLDPSHINTLEPSRRPFHTIQPAMALFHDGRVMAYGSMGGEGQPQTQAAIFSRYAYYGQNLQTAITAPRWLLGRTWGDDATNVRIESRFCPEVIASLRAAGHDIKVVGAFEEAMGHAGALVAHSSGARSGTIEGASDPRSDGSAAGF
jgi:oxamate amidohydrolase